MSLSKALMHLMVKLMQNYAFDTPPFMHFRQGLKVAFKNTSLHLLIPTFYYRTSTRFQASYLMGS
jgi:hypothetical protein